MRYPCKNKASKQFIRGMRLLPLIFSVSTLVACGGGGSGSDDDETQNLVNVPANTAWSAGVFLDQEQFVAKCAIPRSGVDPETGTAFPDVQGSVLDEKNWLRSWSHDFYLWYSEIVDNNPANFSVEGYFDQLITEALTSSGNFKDNFHFSLPTEEWLERSQSGTSSGYGLQWIAIDTRPPRKFLVAYTEANTPATTGNANITRGAEVLFVDGVDVKNSNTNIEIDTFLEGLYPSGPNRTHTFVVKDPGASTNRTFTMTSANVAFTPVKNVRTISTSSGNVGYMLFNDHVATSEQSLINAVNEFNQSGINDLVLDVRYNSGGHLAIASQLAYMIAGSAQTDGETFENLSFNDKYQVTHPITGQTLSPVPFYDSTVGLSTLRGQPLPTLNLTRVFILTGSQTCSASESILNGLRGVGVEVIQIGSTTCGKPYGFYPQDNCGTTYFTIQFSGENAQGFGEYPDGFSPSNVNSSALGSVIPGCRVEDDFLHELGDINETRLRAALIYRQNPGTCPAANKQGNIDHANNSFLAIEPRSYDGYIRKPQWLQNRIVTPNQDLENQ